MIAELPATVAPSQPARWLDPFRAAVRAAGQPEAWIETPYCQRSSHPGLRFQAFQFVHHLVELAIFEYRGRPFGG